MNLRGPRRLDATSEMTLQFQSASKEPIGIEFVTTGARKISTFDLRAAGVNEWKEATLKIGAALDQEIVAVRFTSQSKEPFGVDDVLIYTPEE